MTEYEIEARFRSILSYMTPYCQVGNLHTYGSAYVFIAGKNTLLDRQNPLQSELNLSLWGWLDAIQLDHRREDFWP